MAGNDGVVGQQPTQLGEIHFYAGVKLDPEEFRYYIPQPPAGTDLTAPISSWWTREAFEEEVLNPYEVPELLIDPSYFQNINNKIYSPNSFSDFSMTNINFVKVVNRTANTDGTTNEKIYYGFVNYIDYDNDGNTIVDWYNNEFYSNIWNGIEFADSKIIQAHYQFSESTASKTNGTYSTTNNVGLLDDDVTDAQIKIVENYDTGSARIVANTSPTILGNKDDIPIWGIKGDSKYNGPVAVSGTDAKGDINSNGIAFLVIEFSQTQQESNTTSTSTTKPILQNLASISQVGISSQRGYLVVPFDITSGVVVEAKYYYDSTISQQKTTNLTNVVEDQTYHSTRLGDVLSYFSLCGAFGADGSSVGNISITYDLGVEYSIESNSDGNEVLNFEGNSNNNLVGGLFQEATYEMTNVLAGWPVSVNGMFQWIATPRINGSVPAQNVSNYNENWTYYGIMMKCVENVLGNTMISWLLHRGGMSEKMCQFVTTNIFESDTLMGSFTASECTADLNGGLKSWLLTGAPQSIRNDLIVAPYAMYGSGGTSSYPNIDSVLSKKFVSQRSSTIPFFENPWTTYAFLNQNQMAQAQNNIKTQYGMQTAQNSFTEKQAQQQANNNTAVTNLSNTQNAVMTGFSAQEAMNVGTMNNYAGLISAGVSSKSIANAAGAGAGFGLTNAALGLQKNYSMFNAGVQNQQNSAMTSLQNKNSMILAKNAMTFGNQIAKTNEKMSSDTLHAGWADTKLSPAQSISGGSMIEYLTLWNLTGIFGIFSTCSRQSLFTIAKILLMYGEKVDVFDNPQTLMFTKKKVNYIETEKCNIKPSSLVENSVRQHLEALFNKGIQIWHDLDQMANNDYADNFYQSQTIS